MSRRKKRIVQSVQISGIADKGMSVGRAPDGEVIFVKGAVPGDIVDVLVLRKKKKVAHGVVHRIIKESPHRVPPFCSHFEDCGGCKWQDLNYKHQVYHKWITVKDAMTRIAKLDEHLIEPIIKANPTIHYRNKLEFSFSDRQYIPQSIIDTDIEIQQVPALGFHVAGAWDKILDIEKCYLQDNHSNEIRNFIKSYCIEHHYSFYNPRNHEGLMRNIIIRNTSRGEWMVIVIFAYDSRSKIKPLMDAIGNEFDYISSLNYVINRKKNDTIYDLDIHCWKGKSYIVEQLGEVKYKIGPKSFFQTNAYQALELFRKVVDFAQLGSDDLVYDLYTGLGSIALFIADKVRKVVGIEEVEAAIEDAKENALFNGIGNCIFYTGDVKEMMTGDFVAIHEKPDVVITDPPRAGMHETVCRTLLRLEAPRIVYVSCNPATQARDINILSEKYKVSRIKPVDMFPHTHHVENVVLLILNKL